MLFEIVFTSSLWMPMNLIDLNKIWMRSGTMSVLFIVLFILNGVWHTAKLSINVFQWMNSLMGIWYI